MVSPGETLTRCPLCGNDRNLSARWDTNIIQCPVCSLSYVGVMPTLPQLADMYSASFFEGSSSYADYVAEKDSLQLNFQHRIRTLLKYKPEGRLFEAGCAHGFFLEAAQTHWDVSGMDISEEAIAYAKREFGFDVHVGDFESYPLPPESYDVIAMWDTIEHLYDPFKAIELSAKALRPSGILAMTTGDIGTLVPRLQGKSWRLIHPCHLYYFSRQSMTRLLEDNGLKVAHYTHAGNFRTLSQLSMLLTYGRAERSWRHDLFDRINKIKLMSRIKLNINLFDIMFVIAQKV